jgi:hypothetical protein
MSPYCAQCGVEDGTPHHSYCALFAEPPLKGPSLNLKEAVTNVCGAAASLGEKRVERVNHPAHYGGGENPYETIKVLEAWFTIEELIGFCKGNAIKYLSRAGKHVTGDSALQDAQKGRWYIDRMIGYLEKRK